MNKLSTTLAAAIFGANIVAAPAEAEAAKRNFAVVGCTSDRFAIRASIKNAEARDFDAIKRGFQQTTRQYSRATFQGIIKGTVDWNTQDKMLAKFIRATGNKITAENWGGNLVINNKESQHRLICGKH